MGSLLSLFSVPNNNKKGNKISKVQINNNRNKIITPNL